MANRIALIGGETLLGREVREVFSESSLGGELRLIAADEEETGKLVALDGAAAFLSKLDPGSLEDAEILVLCGSPKSSREALAANPSAFVVDLTYLIDEDPDARLRAPQAEGLDYQPDHSGPQIVAHPAAVAIALVLDRLSKIAPLSQAVINVYEPSSERGKAGIEELQQQTVSLLAFKEMPKKVFDAQLAFAMLPQFGEEAQTRLNEIEERIERHLATLLDRMEGIPMPSLRLTQSPVFHGYSFSLWIEFEDAPPVPDLEDALAGDHIDVRGADLEPPTNVSVAGQGGIAIGAITPDRNNGNAVWLWMAADNFRLPAETAAMIVQEYI